MPTLYSYKVSIWSILSKHWKICNLNSALNVLTNKTTLQSKGYDKYTTASLASSSDIFLLFYLYMAELGPIWPAQHNRLLLWTTDKNCQLCIMLFFLVKKNYFAYWSVVWKHRIMVQLISQFRFNLFILRATCTSCSAIALLTGLALVIILSVLHEAINPLMLLKPPSFICHSKNGLRVCIVTQH